MSAVPDTRAHVKRVIHTIHAVEDIDECRHQYQDRLGGLVFAEGYHDGEDRDMALLYVTDHMVEPMSPRDPATSDKPFARYLRNYGPGWHSFELALEGCPEVAARLRADGYRLASDYGVFFFVRPESTGGLLIECCETPMPNDPYDRRNWSPGWAEGMSSTLLRLDHIACIVTDLDAALRFFTGYLDGDVLDDDRTSHPQPGRRVLLRLADTNVALIQPDDQSAGALGRFLQPPTSGIYALVWAVEDATRAQAYFDGLGLTITSADCVSDGFAIDPSQFLGARHEFTARPPA